MAKFQVALIGLNNLFGRVSSILLKQSPLIKCVKLYDVSNINAALDVSSVNTQCRVKAFLGQEQLENALLDTDIIVIGDESQEGTTSEENYLSNLASKYDDYAKAIANASPNAVVVVTTNPINSSLPLLSQQLAKQGCYNCDKVMGATAVDTVRANAILASHLKLDPKDVVLPVIGGSSELTRVPVFSQSRPQFNLDQSTKNRLIERIRTCDKEVRLLKGSPDTLDKCYATVKFLNSVMRGLQGEKNVTDITLSKTNLVSGVEYFSLPVVFGKGGIFHRFGLPRVTELEQTLVNASIVNMKKEADRAALILRGGDPELNELQFLTDEDRASKQKDLFDLFVTTLNEVEEDFNLSFKPNHKANLKDVFKKRLPSKKVDKKIKSNKTKKNPLKALLPLNNGKTKKIAQNKIIEGIQKSLQPRINSNSIELCEPMVCPERPYTSVDQKKEDHFQEPVEEEQAEELEPDNEIQEPKEQGVTNLLYTHNQNFTQLKPSQSKHEEETIKKQSINHSENPVKSQEAKRPQIKIPRSNLKKNAVPQEMKLQKGNQTLSRKSAKEIIDKVGYYFEKLKQNDKSFLETSLGQEVKASSNETVKNSSTTYHYNDNQTNRPGVETKPVVALQDESAKKARQDTTAKHESINKKIGRFQKPKNHSKTMTGFKELKTAFLKDRSSGARSKGKPKPELSTIKKDDKLEKEKVVETKTESHQEKKELTDETREFQGEEEIVCLKHDNDPGLFRSAKVDILNPISVTNYMKGKSNPGKKESVVTRRKYVLTACSLRQNDTDLQNGKTKMIRKRSMGNIIQENTNENKCKNLENTVISNSLKPKDNDATINDHQTGLTASDKIESLKQDPAVTKLDAKPKVVKKESSPDTKEDLVAPSKELKENETEAKENLYAQSVGLKRSDKDAEIREQTNGIGEFKESDKNLMAVKKSKPIKLYTLKAFNEPHALQNAQSATLAPKDAKLKNNDIVGAKERVDTSTPQLDCKSSEISQYKPRTIQGRDSSLGIPRLKIKDKNTSVCEKISRQIKKRAEMEKVVNTITKVSPIPYYSKKFTREIKPDEGPLKSRPPITVESPSEKTSIHAKGHSQKQLPTKMKLKPKKSTPLTKLSLSATDKSQTKKLPQILSGSTLKLPRLKGANSLDQNLDKLLRSPAYKPLRKIDTLTENKEKLEKTQRRGRRSCSLPPTRKSSSETRPPKLKFTVKSQPKKPVNTYRFDSLSTIDFASYWKRKESEENHRLYPCPIPLSAHKASQPSTEKETDVGSQSPPAKSTPKLWTYNNGTCSDLIRAKQGASSLEPYSNQGSWATVGDASIVNKLWLTPMNAIDKRFDEYSTSHIPSLKQTEEKYFLEERYE